METLGLSDSTPKPEARWKALLWPTITNEYDADYITRQGFWVCVGIGLCTWILGVFSGLGWLAFPDALFFFLAANGVRQRSMMAAMLAFLVYSVGTIAVGVGLVRLLVMALLLGNVRGVNLANRFAQRRLQGDLPDEAPLRTGGSLADNVVDLWPPYIWAVGRWVLLPLGLLMILGFTMFLLQRYLKIDPTALPAQ